MPEIACQAYTGTVSKSRLPLICCLGIFLAACGGSNRATSVNTTSGTFGGISTRSVLTQDPVVINSNAGAVAIGLAGTISSATVNTITPPLSETSIAAFTTSGLLTFDYNGENSAYLSSENIEGAPAISSATDGQSVLLYATTFGTTRRYNLTAGTSTVWSTGRPQLVISPNNASVAWTEFSPTLLKTVVKTARANFTNIVTIAPGTQEIFYSVRFVGPDRIAIQGGGEGEFFLCKVDGTTKGTLLGSGATGSADGRFLVHRLRVGGGYDVLVKRNITATGIGTPLIIDAGQSIQSFTVSPDGRDLLYRTTNPTLLRADTLAGTTIGIRQDANSHFMLEWLPALPKKVIVGPGGFSVPPVAGMAFTTSTDYDYGTATGSVRGLVCWDATTRSSSQLRADSGNVTGRTIVMIAEADEIRNVIYRADVRWKTGNLGSLSGVNGLVITFDATRGDLTNIVPFGRSRSGAPTIRRSGDRVILTGDLKGRFDVSTGKMIPAVNGQVSL